MGKRDWLITKRKNNDLTHENVANQVNISRQYYGMIENGERDPSVSIAKKIGEYMQFDWTLFFDQECYKTLHSGNSA